MPRLVVCHLGGGCSVTAVRDGRSVDTTMGFSPLEGVPMTTRSGSVDPGALLYLLREHGLDADDARPRARASSRGWRRSAAAPATCASSDGARARRLRPTASRPRSAAMAAALGGLDALAFTGGIGENSRGRPRPCARAPSLPRRFAVDVVRAREELVVARAVRSQLSL